MDDRPDDEGARDAALHARLVEAAYSPASTTEEARAALTALARLRAVEAERTRGSADADEAGTAGSDDAVETPPPASNDQPQGRPVADRSRLSIAALGVSIAVVVGAALGFGAASRLGAPATTPASSTPSALSQTVPGAFGFSTSVLKQARDRVQVPTDALPQALRSSIDPSTSRLLYDDDPASASTVKRWRLWVGTGDNPRQLCYVSTFDNEHDAVSCVPLDQAFSGRYVVSQSTPQGSFEALIVDGAIAVQVD